MTPLFTVLYMTCSLLFTSIDGALITDNYLISTFISEVVVKSKLNKSKDKVLVDIALPSDSTVGFEIYTDRGGIKHLWNAQSLHAGRHQLSLKLPNLDEGRYLLHIKVDEQLYKHIVYLSK